MTPSTPPNGAETYVAAYARLWRWLTVKEPQGYWFSRPLWVHFLGAAFFAVGIFGLVMIRYG